MLPIFGVEQRVVREILLREAGLLLAGGLWGGAAHLGAVGSEILERLLLQCLDWSTQRHWWGWVLHSGPLRRR